MEEGDGFADVHGECAVFERDAEKLKKMIEQCKKDVLSKYKGVKLE
jgi:hypothetical protein